MLDFGAPDSAPVGLALPPSTSDLFGVAAPAPAFASSSDPFGAAPDAYGFASQSAPAPAALALVPAPASNGYAGYGAPAPVAVAVAVGYGAPAPAAGGYGAPAPVAPIGGGYGVPAAGGYGAPPPAAVAPTPWGAPPPVATQQAYGAYDGQGAPPAFVAPLSTPQGQPSTPSTLGFSSPPPNFSGFSPGPQPVQAAPTADFSAAPEAAPAAVDPALLSMNTLSGEQQGLVDASASAASGSMADQAYAKLVGMDTFSLVSKTEAERSNPFESTSNASIGGQQSLSTMKKTTPGGGAKSIMNAPAAMVVSSNQNGNYGAQYGGQPMQSNGGYGQHPGMQQPGMQQPGMQQQQAQYGQGPPPPQQYGQGPPPPQQYGQGPPPPQQYGQAPPQPYGQPPAPQQYGQPPAPPQQQGYY